MLTNLVFWFPKIFDFETKLQINVEESRRITCDTAFKSWKSILFDEKFFYLRQKFFTPLFCHEQKLRLFQKSQKNFCVCQKKGGKIVERSKLSFVFKWVSTTPTKNRKARAHGSQCFSFLFFLSFPPQKNSKENCPKKHIKILKLSK